MQRERHLPSIDEHAVRSAAVAHPYDDSGMTPEFWRPLYPQFGKANPCAGFQIFIAVLHLRIPIKYKLVNRPTGKVHPGLRPQPAPFRHAYMSQNCLVRKSPVFCETPGAAENSRKGAGRLAFCARL